jgi:hypothetical protein
MAQPVPVAVRPDVTAPPQPGAARPIRIVTSGRSGAELTSAPERSTVADRFAATNGSVARDGSIATERAATTNGAAFGSRNVATTSPSRTAGRTAAGTKRAAARAPTRRKPSRVDLDEVRVLASAVYAGGNGPLVLGERYLIGVHEVSAYVLGPVDTSPSHVAATRPLVEVEATALEDRFLLSDTDTGRNHLGLAFVSVRGCTIEALALAVAEARAAVVEATRA